MVVQPYSAGTPLASPGVNGVLRTWRGSMSRYPLAGGAFGEGLLSACAGAVCMVWSDLLCHEASVGIRVGVCFCAHQVVSVTLRVWLLVLPPNRRCRHRGALFAMFLLVLGVAGCLTLICRWYNAVAVRLVGHIPGISAADWLLAAM